MSEQAAFFEPLRRKRRRVSKPSALAERYSRLADWYATNKPGLKSISISADDAYSLRKHWQTKDAKHNGEQECRIAGFHVSADGSISWRGFDLIPVDANA